MPEYLTKEEVKQWRGSLEKITLEEFAKRLGKEIEDNKKTHDIVDMYVNNEPISTTVELKPISTQEETVKPKKEIANEKSIETKKTIVEKENANKKITKKEVPATIATEYEGMTFIKKLTDREQKVLECLIENKGNSVKAQDLAVMLDIPRDYIYKYIRNLRKKINEDVIVNSEEGGFVLTV